MFLADERNVNEVVMLFDFSLHSFDFDVVVFRSILCYGYALNDYMRNYFTFRWHYKMKQNTKLIED